MVEEKASGDTLANTIGQRTGFKMSLLWDHKLNQEDQVLIHHYSEGTLIEIVVQGGWVP